MKQAMCEYSAWRPPRTVPTAARLPCMPRVVFPCSELERRPLPHMCRSDQIPAVRSFCSVTLWSVRLHSPAHSSTCFPSARPSPGTSSFDLPLFSPLISLFLHSPPLALLLAPPKTKPPTPPLPSCYSLSSMFWSPLKAILYLLKPFLLLQDKILFPT